MRWEYYVGTNLNPSQLNALGDRGWELLAVVPNGSETMLFYLKRRL